jgi:hypothetical protein
MNLTTVLDVLEQVSDALLEPRAAFRLTQPVPANTAVYLGPSYGGPPLDYAGEQIVLDYGSGQAEVLTVQSDPSGGLYVIPSVSHGMSAWVRWVGFPTGQPSMPLWTQAEMLDYLAQVQNEFLLATRCVYATSDQSITHMVRYYQQPANAIRIERVTTKSPYDPKAPRPLLEVSQTELDLTDARWEAATGEIPSLFFQDQIDTARFGFYPLPSVDSAVTLWYAASAPASVSWLDTLVVPDIFSAYLKWGVIHRALSKDGEARDPRRAQYARQRFEYGIRLAYNLMDIAELPESRPTRRRSYTPLPVEASQ